MKQLMTFSILILATATAGCSLRDKNGPSTPADSTSNQDLAAGDSQLSDQMSDPDSLVAQDTLDPDAAQFLPLPEVTVPIVSTKVELVAAYNTAATALLDQNKGFIDAYQAYVMGNPADADFMDKVKAMNDAGTQWLTAVLTLNGYAVQFANIKADGPVLTVPGVPVTLPIQVGQLIGTTAEKRAQIENMYNSGQIDDNQKKDMLAELTKTQLLDLAGTGLAAGSTVVGGFVVKAGLVAAGASGGVVIGGAILGAAAIGMTVKFVWSYCSKSKNDGLEYETCTLQTHETTVGGIVPLQFPGKGTLVIQVEGKEPIVIEDFGVDPGQLVQIDFEPGDPNSGTPPGTPTVTTLDPSTYNCDGVAGVSATPVPADPGPNEDVTVYATTVPPVPGCTVNFSIVGTDNYSKSESPTTDATGTASFNIPGGAEGVHDTVTISVGTHTTTITYSF